jgi:BirA family biotin operon repressor/biotin-[acetyl-CoA-carboxylase] ligase
MHFRVEWHDQLTSTNATLRERFMGHEEAGGLIIAAHEQTAGRGRQDRRWLSTHGTNLCFSLLVRSDAEPMAVPSLTMATALAVTDMLVAKGIPAAPKWPNDVLVGGRKICGILSERIERSGDPMAGIVVGIGFNVNMTTEEAKAIDRPATSMRIESGQLYDLSDTLEALFQPLEYWIKQWECGGFSNLREIWTEKAGPIGRPLAVHDGSSIKNGTIAGFGEHGELLFDCDGQIETIWSGDAHIRNG